MARPERSSPRSSPQRSTRSSGRRSAASRFRSASSPWEARRSCSTAGSWPSRPRSARARASTAGSPASWWPSGWRSSRRRPRRCWPSTTTRRGSATSCAARRAAPARSRPTSQASSSSRSTASPHEVLRRALRDGNAPVMARWLREGTHRLERWETDWSSQTGACQAGLLHGSNDDMPAFRWWEKDRGRAIVTNHPRDAQELERRHSDGRGLLHEDGASRANILSGDAPHSMLTMSTVLVRGRGTARARLRRVLRTPLRGRAHRGARLRRLRPRAPRAGAAGPRRRAAADPALAHVRARARVGDGGAARPAGLRHRRRHDGRAARRLLDLPRLRRGRPPFGHRAPRHAGRPAPGRPPDRAGADRRSPTRRGPTSSSCCPITASRRARPSPNATA